MSTIKDEHTMIKAKMEVAKKNLKSGMQKRDEGNKEILEAEKMIASIQTECTHPPYELITFSSNTDKKCGICGKSIE